MLKHEFINYLDELYELDLEFDLNDEYPDEIELDSHTYEIEMKLDGITVNVPIDRIILHEKSYGYSVIFHNRDYEGSIGPTFIELNLNKVRDVLMGHDKKLIILANHTLTINYMQ